MKHCFLSLLAFFSAHLLSAQTVYTFQGSGNWSDSANWLNRQVPPTSLPKTDTVIVNPAGTGECVLDEMFFMADSASLQVRPGKKFRLLQGIASSKVKLSDRLHVIDSSVIQLVSDSAQLSQGIYEFSSADSLPSIAVGDFVAGSTGTGYLGKVTDITYLRPAPGQRPAIVRMIMNLVTATLAEVVEIGDFSVRIPVNIDLATLPGFNASSGNISLQVSNTNVVYNANWNMTMRIAGNRVQYFEMTSSGGEVTGSFDTRVTTTGIGNWETETFLKKIKLGRIPLMIGNLPAYINVEAQIKLKAAIQSDGVFTREKHVEVTQPVNMGVRYKNGNWQRVFDLSDPVSVSVEQYFTLNRNSTFRLALGPELSFRVYGVAGPAFFAGVAGEYKERFEPARGRWDIKTEAFGVEESAVNVEVMDINLIDLVKQEKETPRLTLFTAPDTVIKITSTDNQSALFNEYLPQPIQVRVTNSFNNPVANVPVFFSVVEGGGSVEEQRVLTDANGYAQTRWKMGVTYGARQVAEARVEDAVGVQVSMPARFTAKTPMLVGNWKLKSFANGVLPGTLVDVYDSSCTNILRYRYSELVDDLRLDSTDFSDYNEERVVSSGIGWDPQTCTVVSNGPGTDSVYQTTTTGTYLVTGNNIVTYYIDGQEIASYSFQFITFDRIKGGENEYERQ